MVRRNPECMQILPFMRSTLAAIHSSAGTCMIVYPEKAAVFTRVESASTTRSSTAVQTLFKCKALGTGTATTLYP